MKYLFSIVLFCLVLSAYAQNLSEVNLNYHYATSGQPIFKKKLVNSTYGLQLQFELIHGNTNDAVIVLFELRKSYKDESPLIVPITNVNIDDTQQGFLRGTVRIPEFEENMLLVAKVESSGRLYFFEQSLNSNYPINGYLLNWDGKIIFDNYITSTDSIGIFLADTRDSLITIFYYKHTFNPASPPMAESVRAEKTLVPDSVFQFNYFKTIKRFKKEGLYLVQSDTSSAKGFTFRVENEFYPKYGKLADLPSPLMYITTKNEFERLDKARTSKVEFDRIIIDITKDTERAKLFIRNYYRRVELANQFFTSFKEGWKTDRGMVYLIYGMPEEVYKTDGREFWIYPIGNQKLRFSFARSGTIFDPENYVLVREKRFADSWFRTVDLWRKGRL